MKIQNQVSETIIATVDRLVDLIKPTFGPNGYKVIIGKGQNVAVLDDGVQIAKDLILEDPAENYILKLIKEVAIKTNERVGDGTTSSLIILQALLHEAHLSKLSQKEIVSQLKKGLAE